MGGHFVIAKNKQEIEELETKLNDPDIWNDVNKAQEINHNMQYEIITKLNDYGNTDHGLYDKESSTYLLKQIYQIIIDNH